MNDTDSYGNAAQVCPNSSCGYDHHEENSNFCGLCGTLLFQRCDDCIRENPRYSKFCHYCGTSLDDLRNFSPGFTQKDITDTEEEI